MVVVEVAVGVAEVVDVAVVVVERAALHVSGHKSR